MCVIVAGVIPSHHDCRQVIVILIVVILVPIVVILIAIVGRVVWGRGAAAAANFH
jgi:hypothetical protein